MAVSAAGRSSPLRCPRLRSNAISLVATRVTRLPPDQKAPTSDCHSRQVLFKLCYTGVAARPNQVHHVPISGFSPRALLCAGEAISGVSGGINLAGREQASILSYAVPHRSRG